MFWPCALTVLFLHMMFFFNQFLFTIYYTAGFRWTQKRLEIKVTLTHSTVTAKELKCIDKQEHPEISRNIDISKNNVYKSAEMNGKSSYTAHTVKWNCLLNITLNIVEEIFYLCLRPNLTSYFIYFVSYVNGKTIKILFYPLFLKHFWSLFSSAITAHHSSDSGLRENTPV